MSRIRILVVDDDARIRECIVNVLKDDVGLTSEKGNQIVEADDEPLAVELATKDSYDLILMDGNLKTGNGASAVAKMRASGVSAIIIMVSGASKELQKGLSAGANYAINKSDIVTGLLPLLQKAGITSF